MIGWTDVWYLSPKTKFDSSFKHQNSLTFFAQVYMLEH